MIEPIVIREISIDDDGGVVLGFIVADDLKANGVHQTRSLYVPRGTDYDDELDALIAAARYLLADVLDDFSRLPVFIPDVEEDEDAGDDDEESDA